MALLACLALALPGDTIKLTNGGTLEGIVLKETDSGYVVKLKYGTVTLPKDEVASIEKSKAEAAPAGAGRLTAWERAIEVVVARKWATDFRQIPATVIDKGVLKNVPYFSHRSGNWEFNIYGDPDAPACLEIGVHKELLKDAAAKQECLEVMLALLTNADDRALLKSLDLAKDRKDRDGLTFEVTPETAEDAYGGWWISVYDVKALDGVRATEKELEDITVSDADVEKEEEEAKKAPPPKKDPKTGAIPHDPYWHYRWVKKDLPIARAVPLNRIQSTPRRVYVRGFHRAGGRYARPAWGIRRR